MPTDLPDDFKGTNHVEPEEYEPPLIVKAFGYSAIIAVLWLFITGALWLSMLILANLPHR